MPASEATVIQKQSRFIVGNAISDAPICSGNKKLPKPNCGAAVSTKKTISEPWSRRMAA